MCYCPKQAYLLNYVDNDGEERRQVVFNPLSFDFDSLDEMFSDESKGRLVPIQLPCGRCIECQNQKSNEWSYRILHESLKYHENCFITLTYRDSPVSIVWRDFTLFIKRLRKHIYPKKVKYFVCGEYGSKGGRPHFHACLFGYMPDDLQYFFSDKGNRLYKSKTIEILWTHGFVSVGKLTKESAKYCAKYMQKFNTLLPDVVMPGIRVSKGLGLDISDMDYSDKCYFHGRYIRYPRYYLKVMERYGADVDSIRENRKPLNDILFSDRDDELKDIDSQVLSKFFAVDKNKLKGVKKCKKKQ